MLPLEASQWGAPPESRHTSRVIEPVCSEFPLTLPSIFRFPEGTWQIQKEQDNPACNRPSKRFDLQNKTASPGCTATRVASRMIARISSFSAAVSSPPIESAVAFGPPRGNHVPPPPYPSVRYLRRPQNKRSVLHFLSRVTAQRTRLART